MLRLLMLIGALALSACKAEGPECSEQEACPFGSFCVEGVCETRSCSTSAQCPMELHCAEGACAEGCAADSDCYPGDACDPETATCALAACEDSHVDCGFKEFCNNISGECFEASGYYCGECSGDADCGGNGNLCYGGWCAVTCASEGDCPSGFTCIGFGDVSGNIYAYGCYAACWAFDAEEESRAADPLVPHVLPDGEVIMIETTGAGEARP